MKKVNLILLTILCGAMFTTPLLAQKKAPDIRITNALKQSQTEYKIGDDGVFTVTCGVGEKRSQSAFVSSATDMFYGTEMRNIFSFAAFSKTPFPPDVMSRLLDENVNRVSTWGIIKIDDEYAIVNLVFVPANADSKRLNSAIESVVVAADEFEARMSKEDKY